MLVECDDPLTVHKFCSMLPAVRVELEIMAWRDGLTKKS